MRKYDGILFDLDGVICRTDQYHYLAWKKLADGLGIPFDEQVNERLRGVSRMESLEIILRHGGKICSEREKEELAEEKNRDYVRLLRKMTPSDVSSDVKETMDALKKAGCRLAIGSSSKNARYILERIGLSDYFDAVVDGNEIRHSKPDPEVFLSAARKLGLPPGRCLVVEDAAAGVEAAVRGGFDAAGLGSARACVSARYRLAGFAELKDVVAAAGRDKKDSLRRMDGIVAYWKSKRGVKAVAAFGSLAQLSRFDRWSDLDFLVICEEGGRASLLNGLSGLEKLCPIAYVRTGCGGSVQLLFDDGILCDFGVVTEKQASGFPHGQGRILWCDSGFSPGCVRQNSGDVHEPDNWAGDALLHVFTGLLRQQRGETAAAFEEIQVLAVKSLLAGIYQEKHFEGRDPFSPMRRAEACVPGDWSLPALMPGYSHNVEAAEEILARIQSGTYPEGLMAQAERLLDECRSRERTRAAGAF